MKILRQMTNSKASLEEGAGGAGGATETLERPLVVGSLCGCGCGRAGWAKPVSRVSTRVIPRKVLVGSSRACVAE